ncbi:MAG: insulinase family protein [Bacteroides sp.]|nr:insulinase family protein [Bacteroides sp.]MCM1412876.1 insulinase family protein [Bacteroides sp.]MCM1471545.1 insulinase family protein [Bacteroides sp.]
MTNSIPQLMTLDNGLRIVACCDPNAKVDYFGLTVDAGSRDDGPRRHGLAHFVEHTLFKGTDRRRSCHIINRMEACGGELNAYTTKESTTVYSVFPSGNLGRAVELIADLVINSRFPKKEIDMERGVVADEIDSYLDIPAEAVYDDFEDRLWAGSSLGHNILGTKEALSEFDSAVCRDYLHRLYAADNMVVFYSGNRRPAEVERLISRHFATLPLKAQKINRTSPVGIAPFQDSVAISSHQTHTIIGTSVCDMYSNRRYALSLLVNMLGGPGMNSLLNVELREKRGLVYSVEANASFLTDTGIFTVYYGCDPEDSRRCHQLTASVIDRLVSTAITSRRLSAAIRQYVGQMIVSTDNRENMIIALAKQLLYRGGIVSFEDTIDRIRSLTPDQLREAAAMIAPDGLSTLTLI